MMFIAVLLFVVCFEWRLVPVNLTLKGCQKWCHSRNLKVVPYRTFTTCFEGHAFNIRLQKIIKLQDNFNAVKLPKPSISVYNMLKKLLHYRRKYTTKRACIPTPP